MDKTEYQEVYGEAIYPRNDSSKRPKQINISILVNEEQRKIYVVLLLDEKLQTTNDNWVKKN